MKQLLFSLLVCATIPSAFGGDKRPVNIRIEVQMVAVPEELALPLTADLMAKEKFAPAYLTVQDLLAKGVAQLVGWPFVTTKSGQRAVIEAIDEIRYATGYTPPTVSFTAGVDTKEPVKIEPKADVTHFDPVPSEFETRNAGVTLEVEAVLAPDGRTIDLNLVPQDIRLSGYHKVSIEKPATQTKIVVEQPDFHTMKVTTSLTLGSGERILIGTFRTNDPPKHIEFFFLKAEVIVVD